MSNVTAIRFPEFLCKIRIPVRRASAFRANPLPDVWDEHDDEVQESKRWLDANAPGWTTAVKSLGACEHELAIGATAAVIEYEVRIQFARRTDRDAWRIWNRSRQGPELEPEPPLP
jgi:hypothetical protein